ncbi:MAG: HAD-IC family P-type ATPase, partial [Chloroflexota bacterium]
VTAGSIGYISTACTVPDAISKTAERYEQLGYTSVVVALDETVKGVLAVADTVRENSQSVITELHTANVQTAMLTGDNPTVAAAVAHQIGVDYRRAGLLPADKSDAVAELRDRYGLVAMIGDGVNDAPALATADVGIAMGGAGSAQAVETADIALMADDLRQLPHTIKLSRFATGIITQNIVLSVAVKLVISALAIAGLTSLWFAIFADVGMLVLVTLNGIRPLRYPNGPFPNKSG